MNVSLDFRAFFQEFLPMLDLKFEVMFVRIGSKPDLLDNGFGGIGLNFLLFLTLIVEEFVEFDDPANGGIGIWGDHDQVLAHFFSPIADRSGGVDAGLNFSAGHFTDIFEVVAYQTDVGHSDVAIDLKFVLVWFGRRVI